MASLVDALANLVTPQAEEIVIEKYMESPSVYDRIADVRPLSGEHLYGHRKTILETSGELLERDDFEPVQGDQPGVVGVAAAKTLQFERSIQMSEREAQAIVGTGVLPEYVTERIEGYAQAARRAKNIRFTEHYEQGVLSAGDKNVFKRSYRGYDATNEGFIYDGKAWFATDHPLRGSDTVSNITVSAALSEATFDAALTKYRQTMAVDHRGQRISLVPDFIMVPTGLENLARRIVGSTQLQGTDHNDINPHFGRYEVIANPFLSTTAGWWLGSKRMGIQFYDTGVPSVQIREMPSNRSINISIETRFLILPTDWRHATAQNLAVS